MKVKVKVQHLIKALDYKKDRKVRRAAAEALGQLGDRRAVQPLLTALRDRDWDVQRAAAEALVKAGTKVGTAAVEPLVAALQDQDSAVRRRAAEALGLQALGWQPVDDVQRALLAVARQDWQEAVSLGPAAVQPLVTALQDVFVRDRAGAAWALGKIGDPRAIMPIADLAERAGTRDTIYGAISSLRQVLESAAAGAAPEDLRAVAHLQTMLLEYEETCQGSERRWVTVDCSHVRQLARQELIRRGLEVEA